MSRVVNAFASPAPRPASSSHFSLAGLQRGGRRVLQSVMCALIAGRQGAGARRRAIFSRGNTPLFSLIPARTRSPQVGRAKSTSCTENQRAALSGWRRPSETENRTFVQFGEALTMHEAQTLTFFQHWDRCSQSCE